MKKNIEFTQKFEADIARLEAELIRFKVRGMGFTAEAKDRHDEHIDQLEQKIDEINTKLSEFEKVGEHLWKELQEDIKKKHLILKAVLLDATKTLTTEPGVDDAHGGDDGSYPYGEGLSGGAVVKE